MSDFAPNLPYEVTQDDRTMAVLAQVLQIVGSWIAPLIIFLIRRDSLFVKFHALQALILQVCLTALWMIGGMVFMGTMFATMPSSNASPHSAPPLAVMVLFPMFWLLAMGGWAVILVVAIVYGIKAGRGEWASYPLIGGVARHFLKM